MAENVDLQAEAISVGLQRLQELLENPVATSALELGKNAIAAREYDVLKRLHRSLVQYLQRNGNLLYVGVLGHFSAGKSSTINSLLGTWGTKRERITDLNPTDTTITLITREKNSPSLFGVIREGHVTIRLEPVECELLNEMVLVDTPGTGDPQFIEEVARDFLPICDIILFVFSAASPLDKSDVPLLLELHKRLAFIPIHFVVTRADELRENPNAPISEENINSQKVERFLNGVVARVNTLLSPQVYLTTSFSLIDNRSQFRVEQLKALLRSRCNSSSPQAHVSMHLNKLHYYRSGAKSMRMFFSTVLEKKLLELTKIVEAAQRNIERYHQLVQISNSNLTKTWMEHAAAIKSAGARALELVQPLATLPQDCTGFRSVTMKRTDLVAELARNAKYHATSIASSLRAEVNGALQERLYEVQKQLNATPLQDLSAEVHGDVRAPHIPSPPLKEIQSAASSHHRAQELRDTQADALRDAITSVRHSLSTLHDQADQRAPLCSAAERVQAATESLKTDLNQFFQNVELYRSGVFSHATKESIATLGIGAKLDALETEFTEADKEEFSRTASTDLFPGAQALVDSATAHSLDLGRKAIELLDTCRSIRIERPEGNLEDLESLFASERDQLAVSLQAGLQSEVDRFCSGISIELANLIVEAKSRCDSDLDVLRRARLKRYSIAFVVTGIAFAVASFAYYHLGWPAPKTFSGQAFLNLGCGLLVELVALSALKFKENVPKLLAHTREHLHAKLQADVKQAVENQVKSLSLNSLNEHALSTRLANIYSRAVDLPSPAWYSRATGTLDAIRQLAAKYSDLRKTYVELVDHVRQDALQYFEDSSRNLSVLNQVAGRIKEKAIEPSFELLKATRGELSSVKTEVDAITFD